MHSHLLLALLLAGPGQTDSATPAGEVPPGVEALVRDLGHPEFDRREEATRAIEKVGPAALPALRQAAGSPDAEVRRRVGDLTETLERRAASIRLLAPQKLRFAVNDMPVTAAVEEFAKQTGMPLRVVGNRTVLLNRRVTVDTGEVPFWEAYDRFCKAAGVVEPVPDASESAVSEVSSSGNVIDLRRRTRNMPTVQETKLQDGKPTDLPTDVRGSVRLRAYPSITAMPGTTREAGEALFGLEVAPAPGVAWHSVISLRIDHAVDEHGQPLSQPEVFIPGEDPTPRTGRERIIIVDGETEVPPTGTSLLPVRLRLGEKQSKRIVRLEGTVTAEVRTPPETLVTVKDLMKATGQTYRLDDGTTLRVHGATKEEAGGLRVRVSINAPLRQTAFGKQLVGRVIRVNRALRSNLSELPTEGGQPILVLRDAEGKEMKLDTCEYMASSHPNGSTRDFDLTYEAPTKPGKITMEFYGRKFAVVDVQFTLRDVRLP